MLLTLTQNFFFDTYLKLLFWPLLKTSFFDTYSNFFFDTYSKFLFWHLLKTSFLTLTQSFFFDTYSKLLYWLLTQAFCCYICLSWHTKFHGLMILVKNHENWLVWFVLWHLIPLSTTTCVISAYQQLPV